MKMVDDCPLECKQDRDSLHRDIESKTASLKWFFGLAIIVLMAVFGILYSGQRTNADRIGAVHARITSELGGLREVITKEINDLTKVVIRMDERAKLRERTRDEKDREENGRR